MSIYVNSHIICVCVCLRIWVCVCVCNLIHTSYNGHIFKIHNSQLFFFHILKGVVGDEWGRWTRNWKCWNYIYILYKDEEGKNFFAVWHMCIIINCSAIKSFYFNSFSSHFFFFFRQDGLPVECPEILQFIDWYYIDHVSNFVLLINICNLFFHITPFFDLKGNIFMDNEQPY